MKSDVYDKTVTTEIPADHAGKSLDDDGILFRVVEEGLQDVPGVVLNHVQGRFNDFAHELRHGEPRARREAAIKLAGIALRYAWENRK